MRKKASCNTCAPFPPFVRARFFFLRRVAPRPEQIAWPKPLLPGNGMRAGRRRVLGSFRMRAEGRAHIRSLIPHGQPQIGAQDTAIGPASDIRPCLFTARKACSSLTRHFGPICGRLCAPAIKKAELLCSRNGAAHRPPQRATSARRGASHERRTWHFTDGESERLLPSLERASKAHACNFCLRGFPSSRDQLRIGRCGRSWPDALPQWGATKRGQENAKRVRSDARCAVEPLQWRANKLFCADFWKV